MSLNAPTTIYSGDSLKFRPYFEEYLPSQGWLLQLSISNGTIKYVIDASSDLNTEEFIVDVLPTVTSTYLADKYTIHARVKKDSDIYTINESAYITIKQDPFIGNGLDNRTFNQKMVDLLQKVIYEKSSDTVLEMVIGTRQLKHYQPRELVELFEYFKNEVAKEEVINDNKSKYSTRLIGLRG